MPCKIYLLGKSIINKKGDGSQVKESTDSSTTIEDDESKGKFEPSPLFRHLFANYVHLISIFSCIIIIIIKCVCMYYFILNVLHNTKAKKIVLEGENLR